MAYAIQERVWCHRQENAIAESIPFSLPPQQQISIIMSINGVINGAIPNVKWPTLVLTEANSGKVDGEEFTKIDNQRVRGS